MIEEMWVSLPLLTGLS